MTTNASPLRGVDTLTLDALRRSAEERARLHASRDGRVCGYMTSAAPVEMMKAAGFAPLLLCAGDVRETPLADHYMEGLFDPVVRGVFERLLRGDFDYLSAIVLPRANDSVHRLYYYLCELARTGEVKLSPVLLFDVVQTPGEASDAYSLERAGHFWEQLRALGDDTAGDSQLAAAIAEANQLRQIVEAFVAQRREGGVAGEVALTAFAAPALLPHGEALAVIAAAADRPRQGGGPRVVVAGSAHDDAGLHKLIESLSGDVVGDFHTMGELSSGAMITEGAAPLAAIAQRYRDGVMGSRSFDDPAAAIAAFAKAARADAVVFSYFPTEEALTWDYPEQKAALEAMGVRTLRLADQARPFDVGPAREALSAFMAELKGAVR
jgi:benzoyl-CoA reductase/2-hydroxyglutaryl-CoA dehydratase subunit BcrC/BadD/HgdB